jgi:hypothetical protein
MVEVEELCGGEDFCRHEICLPPQVGRGGGYNFCHSSDVPRLLISITLLLSAYRF